MGQVKWFNNKAGYGFVTMSGSAGARTDIFVHYSTVLSQDMQYKFLVQGEYCEFDIVDSTSEDHRFQAVNVTGMNGGKLMCETRHPTRHMGERKSMIKERVYPTLVTPNSPLRAEAQTQTHDLDLDTQEFETVQTKRGNRKMKQVQRQESEKKQNSFRRQVS